MPQGEIQAVGQFGEPALENSSPFTGGARCTPEAPGECGEQG